MSYLYNLKDIKKSLKPNDIIELLTFLGADRYEEKDNYIIFPTICHNENSETSSLKLYYYKDTQAFHCYSGCERNYSIYDIFIKRYEVLGKKYNFYRDIVCVITKNTKIEYSEELETGYQSLYEDFVRKNKNIELPYLSSSLLNIFSTNSAALINWLNEGIREEILKEFNIRYSIKDNKIIIPHYDYLGNLIGIRGRCFNEEDLEKGKYLPVYIEGNIYSHPLSYNLYGLNMAKEDIRKTRTAIVYEGEKSVLKQKSLLGLNNSVAICGSNFNKYQLDLLVKNGAEHIILALDKEFEDNVQKEKYFNKLWGICKKYSHYCNMSFLFDQKDMLKLKDSPIDSGREVFAELLKRRIHV